MRNTLLINMLQRKTRARTEKYKKMLQEMQNKYVRERRGSLKKTCSDLEKKF